MSETFVTASDLTPAMIGRRIAVTEENGADISDTLTSIMAADHSGHILVLTRNVRPNTPPMNRGLVQFEDYWRLDPRATVEVGERTDAGSLSHDAGREEDS